MCTFSCLRNESYLKHILISFQLNLLNNMEGVKPIKKSARVCGLQQPMQK